MAHDSLTARLQPTYSEAGGPAIGTDLSEVATYAATYGNYASETSTTRTTRSGTSLWAGLTVFETDTNLTWLYTSGWALITLPRCDLTINIATVANATATTLGTTTPANPYTEVQDAHTMHDPVTNPNRITALYSGLYIVTMGNNWSSNATGTRQVIIRKNGTAIPGGSPVVSAATSSGGECSSSIPIQLAASDYIDIGIIQSSGGNLAFAAQVSVALQSSL